MLRKVASRVAWVGRTVSMVFGLALVLALLFGLASMAFAANGENFIIGNGLSDTVRNIATLPTKLTMQGRAGGPALQVTQESTSTNASGIGVKVPRGKAPLKVNASAGKATNLDADKLDGKDSSEFVQNSGEMTFSVFDSWVSSHSPSNPVTVSYRGFWTTFTRGAGEQTQSEVRLAPPLPSSLYGKSMLLTGMEICYDTSDTAVVLSQIKLLRHSSTDGTQAGGNSVVEDNTPTDGNQCRVYRGTPQLMGTNSFAYLEMHVNWSETTSETGFTIQRTTFFLEPSNTAAAPL